MPKLTFIEKDGNRKEVDAPLGLSVMEIAHRFDVDIEGGDVDGAVAVVNRVNVASDPLQSRAFARANGCFRTRLLQNWSQRSQESMSETQRSIWDSSVSPGCRRLSRNGWSACRCRRLRS